MKQFTAKTDEAAVNKFDELFEAAKAENPQITRGQFFSQIMLGNHQSAPDNSEELQEAQVKLQALEVKHQELSDSYDAFFAALCELLHLDYSEATSALVIDEIKDTQHRAMIVPDRVVEYQHAPMLENEIRFTIGEPHLALLQETVKRLSEKYGQAVSMKDVLLDMFARYTIEQFNEWFYDFVINGPDFKNITGYTQKELKAWLNKVDQE